jgi:hypothetical protein
VMTKKPTLSLIIPCCWLAFGGTAVLKWFIQGSASDVSWNITQRIPIPAVYLCKMFFIRCARSVNPINCSTMRQFTLLRRHDVSLLFPNIGDTIENILLRFLAFIFPARKENWWPVLLWKRWNAQVSLKSISAGRQTVRMISWLPSSIILSILSILIQGPMMLPGMFVNRTALQL